MSVVATVGYGAFIAGPPVLGFLGDHVGVLRSLLVVGAMGLLVVPMLYCLIAPLPLPGFLYPAWARALRDTREERMEALLSELSDGD